MARVTITTHLRAEIEKKFKNESKKVFDLIFSLKKNPRKGKGLLGQDSFRERPGDRGREQNRSNEPASEKMAGPA